jgi:hypothetical protein
MLRVPPPTRVAIGTVQIAGKSYEVLVSVEWSRYFQALTAETVAGAEARAMSPAYAALLNDGAEVPDAFPGPPGARGPQGDPGLALFMLQDQCDEQPMLVPPATDGTFVPIASKDVAGGVPGLTLLKLNLKNAAGTIVSWFTTAATVARTWTMPDKDGTVALVEDFAAPPPIGGTTAAAGSFTTLAASAGFGCNGAAPQSPADSGGTLDGVIAALVANGILSS